MKDSDIEETLLLLYTLQLSPARASGDCTRSEHWTSVMDDENSQNRGLCSSQTYEDKMSGDGFSFSYVLFFIMFCFSFLDSIVMALIN